MLALLCISVRVGRVRHSAGPVPLFDAQNSTPVRSARRAADVVLPSPSAAAAPGVPSAVASPFHFSAESVHAATTALADVTLKRKRRGKGRYKENEPTDMVQDKENVQGQGQGQQNGDDNSKQDTTATASPEGRNAKQR